MLLLLELLEECILIFFSSRRRHTSCALVTGVQTCALPIFDAIVIDLTPAEYVINETVALDAPSDAFLDVDSAGKAVHIEFLDASSVFACHFHDHPDDVEIGRASCRERVCPYV